MSDRTFKRGDHVVVQRDPTSLWMVAAGPDCADLYTLMDLDTRELRIVNACFIEHPPRPTMPGDKATLDGRPFVLITDRPDDQERVVVRWLSNAGNYKPQDQEQYALIGLHELRLAVKS